MKRVTLFVTPWLVQVIRRPTPTGWTQSSHTCTCRSCSCIVSLRNTNALQHLGVSVEVGRVKNANKNPVTEKAVQELEEELLCQEPSGGPVNELGLAVATARLNSRIRSQGQ